MQSEVWRKLELHALRKLNNRRRTQLIFCPLSTSTLLLTKTDKSLPARYQRGTCSVQHLSSMESPPARGNAQTQARSNSTLQGLLKSQKNSPSNKLWIAIQPTWAISLDAGKKADRLPADRCRVAGSCRRSARDAWSRD